MKHLLSSRSVQTLITQVFGKPCCRKQVGYRKSLSIGFGAKIPHQNPKARDNYYGEWEVGTYSSAWRIVQSGNILCASHDPVESIKELDAALGQVELGDIVSVQQLTDWDIRVGFDHGITIDFLAATSEEDESFHIFCPQSKHIAFSAGKGWTISESNKPLR